MSATAGSSGTPLPRNLVKVCAIDDTWSGLKLVTRRELRG